MFLLLKKVYDKSTVQLCNKLLYTQCKLNSRLILNKFLEQCKSKMVVPKWIVARIYKSKIKYNSKVEKMFLKSEIATNMEVINTLKEIMDNKSKYLKVKLQSKHYDEFQQYIREIIHKQTNKLDVKNEKNINRLVRLKFGSLRKQNIVNLSSYKLDDKEEFALSFGQNFSVPPKKVNREEVYLGFEKYFKQVISHKPRNLNVAADFKANITALAHNYCKIIPNDNSLINTREIVEAVRKLKSNDSITITKPDKGSGIVIMNKNDYMDKMKTILEDESKFIKLGPVSDFDNILKIEKKINAVFKRLVSSEELSQAIVDDLKPVGSMRPRLYGLPKLHKPDKPLRPILSMINSPQHGLAKFLNIMLEPVITYFSKFVVKDSFVVIQKIRNINAENTFMSSFDVKKLFSSVPLDEVITISTEMLYRLTKPTIKKENFISLLRIATSEVKFSFNDIMYSQVDGVAMGSPLGPTLANIFMGHLEYKVIPNLSNQISYLRYMDDCLVISNSREDNYALFKNLNGLHEAISFTKEEENNNILPFLDILIIRESNRFLTTVHRKATFTGQYLHFQSFCSKKRKVNLIRTLCHRAHMICSPELLEKEIKNISDIFIKNGYPESLVSRVIKLHKESLSVVKPYGPEKLHVVLKVPYAGNKSYSMMNKVKSITESAFFAINLG